MIGKPGPTPALRRSLSACASGSSAASRALLATRSAAFVARTLAFVVVSVTPLRAAFARPRTSPWALSRRRSSSLIRSSVCLRPRASSFETISLASSRVIRPRLTESSTTSWIRSRERVTLRSSASRNASTLLSARSADVCARAGGLLVVVDVALPRLDAAVPFPFVAAGLRAELLAGFLRGAEAIGRPS